MDSIYLICKDSFADSIDTGWFATNEDDIKNITKLELKEYGEIVVDGSFTFNWEHKLFTFKYYPVYDQEDIESRTWYIRKIKNIGSLLK